MSVLAHTTRTYFFGSTSRTSNGSDAPRVVAIGADPGAFTDTGNRSLFNPHPSTSPELLRPLAKFPVERGTCQAGIELARSLGLKRKPFAHRDSNKIEEREDEHPRREALNRSIFP